MVNQKSLAYGAEKSAIREIAGYAAQRRAEIGAQNVFDFSIGNPSVPAPEVVRTSIEAAMQLPPQQVHSYTPAIGIPQAREAIAASLRRRFGEHAAQANNLILTCGAAASVSLAINSIVSPGEEVVVIAPYFPEYRVWIDHAQATCIEVLADQTTFQIDVDAVCAALTPKTRAVIINSPNNPVGAVYTRENLNAFATMLRKRSAELGTDIYVISDEPYKRLFLVILRSLGFLISMSVLWCAIPTPSPSRFLASVLVGCWFPLLIQSKKRFTQLVLVRLDFWALFVRQRFSSALLSIALMSQQMLRPMQKIEKF